MDLFAKRLRERARQLQLSDAEVARRAGLAERRYGHYVRGMREPDYATLVRICACWTSPLTIFCCPSPCRADRPMIGGCLAYLLRAANSIRMTSTWRFARWRLWLATGSRKRPARAPPTLMDAFRFAAGA
jgi:transcriptional regulator with XRE-family HTH domain